MKSNTYELHNYADLGMSTPAKESRKRKQNQTSNSRRNEKYSLRQKRRNATRNGSEVAVAGEPAATLPAKEATSTKATARCKSTPKAKTKAAPLSKYRRKTANARERTRMREINMAFEQLRHCVPQAITGEDQSTANEKLTKITTLRLAMKYITMLNESLANPGYESNFIVECLHESANRAPHVSEEPSEPEPEPTLPPKAPKSAKGKNAAGKRPSKKSKLPTRSPESCYASSSIGSPASCAAACSPSSAYASLSCSNSSDNGSHTLDAHSLLSMQALSELNTLLMESDGDSLHCLGLLQPPQPAGLPLRGDMPMSMSSLDKPDVELSLRLLNSNSSDSFDFGSDQQPSACISPLANLDSFHPFSELLHTDFTEPNALDLFLT